MPNKVELDAVLASYAGTSRLNANFDKIETAFNGVVWADGSVPMTGDLNLNGFSLVGLSPAFLASLQGVDGVNGTNGVDGAPGAPGADGADAQNPNYTYVINTLAAGNPATLSATGTYPNITLTFGIPQGAQGPAGADGTGSVNSVAASGGTTGMSFTGGPITTSGTLTLTGTLAVANGGTGSTTASAARTALGAAASGAITASGLTMTTARLIGRTTAATGAPEEITAGSTLTLSGGTLSVASAPILTTARTINGVSFNGSANISVNTNNALTCNNAGSGAASGQTFNGSAAATISYNTIGAAPDNPRIQSVTSSATVTPTFSNDQVNITAQAAALNLANPTGTAVDGWGIVIRIKDNGTAQSITYGTQYRALGVTLPTTTVISKTLYLGMIYNSADTKWDVVSVAQEA